jgi:hypothetical protein
MNTWFYMMCLGYYVLFLAGMAGLWHHDFKSFVERFSRATQAKIWLTFPLTFQLWLLTGLCVLLGRELALFYRTIARLCAEAVKE